MVYFIAALVFITGLMFVSMGRCSADKLKNIKELLADDKNRQEASGSLKVIKIKSSRHGFECECELAFTNNNGKRFSYKESFFSSDSKASFLRNCENRGEVQVGVIYDKSSPEKHFIKELKPLEVNENSRLAYALIGALFMLLGIFIVGAELIKLQM